MLGKREGAALISELEIQKSVDESYKVIRGLLPLVKIRVLYLLIAHGKMKTVDACNSV